MALPLEKTRIKAFAQEKYLALNHLIQGLGAEQLAFAPAEGEWSIKDVLAHLYEWQQMYILWVENSQRGHEPEVPAPGYTWQDLPALNQAIYEKYRNIYASEALALYHNAHEQTMQFVEDLPEAELVKPGLYPWLKNSTLLRYFHGVSGSHYAWAIKMVKHLHPGRIPIAEQYAQQPASTLVTLLNQQSLAASRLLEFFAGPFEPSLQVYPGWSIKDILAHLTYWHEAQANILATLAAGMEPQLLKGPLQALNQHGLDELRGQSLEQLEMRFIAAEHTIQNDILYPGIPSYAYRRDSAPRTPARHLEVMTAHIHKHLDDIHRAMRQVARKKPQWH